MQINQGMRQRARVNVTHSSTAQDDVRFRIDQTQLLAEMIRVNRLSLWIMSYYLTKTQALIDEGPYEKIKSNPFQKELKTIKPAIEHPPPLIPSSVKFSLISPILRCAIVCTYQVHTQEISFRRIVSNIVTSVFKVCLGEDKTFDKNCDIKSYAISNHCWSNKHN